MSWHYEGTEGNLVWATLAFFCAVLGAVGVYRFVYSPKILAIHAELYPSIGNREAEIEIIVFEDLVCHTCRYFTMEVFPMIQSTYIAPGIVKYVMSIFPIAFLPNSEEIANAALSVFAQEPRIFFSLRSRILRSLF